MCGGSTKAFSLLSETVSRRVLSAERQVSYAHDDLASLAKMIGFRADQGVVKKLTNSLTHVMDDLLELSRCVSVWS